MEAAPFCAGILEGSLKLDTTRSVTISIRFAGFGFPSDSDRGVEDGDAPAVTPLGWPAGGRVVAWGECSRGVSDAIAALTVSKFAFRMIRGFWRTLSSSRLSGPRSRGTP